MNITELARTLRITPRELRMYMPQFGLDIGARAIKINKSVANRIIRDWPKFKKKLDAKKAEQERREKEEMTKPKIKHKIIIPQVVTVKDFSVMIDSPVNIVLAELMKNGIFASVNERIDFDTAWLVGSELGYEVVKKEENESEKEDVVTENKLEKILSNENEKNLLTRPPVIVVMGHVDHGKTSLLDAIRKTNVIGEESGGITQHIGAYQVTRRDQLITFIDTPGHEAFTAMRSRGARIADVAILVVAADDGVKPQTIEALKIIEAAKLPYVVAINKMDKDGANIDKTKQELSSKLKIIPEDWGGKISCLPISAKKNTGIIELLDMILLIAQAEATGIKANPNADAAGTVIESHIDKGAGPVATILIQNGTLRIGDRIMINGNDVGKIRGLNNYLENKIQEATPATPVQIIGLKGMPHVGDVLEVGVGEKIKKKKLRDIGPAHTSSQAEQAEEDENMKKVNLIIKSDVLGSVEAIEESLEKINTKDVKVKIVHRGLGNVNESDIMKAEATNAVVVGFNVKTPVNIENMAREKRVEVKSYSIIYDLLDDMKEKMKSVLVSRYEREDVGRLKVFKIFRTEKDAQIIGGKVLDGVVEIDSTIEVLRDKELVCEGKMTNLQAGKQDVKIVETDEECGLRYEGSPEIQEEDILQFYKMKEIKIDF